MKTVFVKREQLSFFGFVAAGLRDHAARRRQRLALRSLMELSPGRLADLGIDASDVMAALSATSHRPPASNEVAVHTGARAAFA